MKCNIPRNCSVRPPVTQYGFHHAQHGPDWNDDIKSLEHQDCSDSLWYSIHSAKPLFAVSHGRYGDNFVFWIRLLHHSRAETSQWGLHSLYQGQSGALFLKKSWIILVQSNDECAGLLWSHVHGLHGILDRGQCIFTWNVNYSNSRWFGLC